MIKAKNFHVKYWDDLYGSAKSQKLWACDFSGVTNIHKYLMKNMI